MYQVETQAANQQQPTYMSRTAMVTKPREHSYHIDELLVNIFKTTFNLLYLDTGMVQPRNKHVMMISQYNVISKACDVFATFKCF